MHTGLTLVFQNLERRRADGDVYAHELRYAARAEGLGFDSVWTPEHHFTDYQLTPNVPQFLSWVAGQTSRLRLGTMVSVLPWHDPIRVAESFTMLDHLSGGRSLLGIGRGLGRAEFEGFQVEMGKSRRLFTEYTEAITGALESGVLEYRGDVYTQPRVDIRPEPWGSFRGRTFASAVSPESIDLMARLGIGLMVIAQKPWETVKAELAEYRKRFYGINGHEAPKPVVCVFVGAAPTERQAQEMRDVYLQRYAVSTVEHYEFDNVGFAEIEGYEYYAGLSRNIARHGIDKFSGFLADLQVWGTPEQVVEKLLGYVNFLDAGAVLLVPAYGGMPAEVADANFELIAREVLPALKAHDVGGDIGVRYAEEQVRDEAQAVLGSPR
ncbi:LLM class flavin-dependent oxidoreductase [Amycolatopsis sp. Poz14]|uniref:LLM class flavin-dependent oxidoreductase n=1 Tax=Amycolatopsis sp. Poz14 TaxID=1447705 RepID=UPI001EE7CD77|nr:LLM class flavin-dependent oxidoreductase [Amycolatopsis sp. Poz14]MCG3754046.1 LLM class flavin-dependent oxidoreductase [Amycolatopsis sp. Poz14]